MRALPAWYRSLASIRLRFHHDSLLRNSLYIMATTCVNAAGGYLFWISAARFTSAGEVGLAAALLSTVTLLSIVTNRGIGGALVAALGKSPDARTWSLTLDAGLFAGAAAGLIVAVLAAILLPAISPHFHILWSSTTLLVAFISGVAVWSVADLLDAAYLAERQAGRVLVRNAMTTLAKNVFMLLMVTLIAKSGGSIFIASILGCATGGSMGMYLVRLMQPGYRPVFGRAVIQRAAALSSQVLGHHLVIVGGLAPTYLLPIIVATRLSANGTAYFYTTWMIGSIFFMISPAVASSLFAEGSHSAESVGTAAMASIRLILLLLLPIALGIVLLGKPILSLFGVEYVQHGYSLLLILVASAVPDAVTNIYISVLRVQSRFNEAALLNLGMAALTLLLAWVLTPVLGIEGTGWAWLIAQTVGSVSVGTRLLLSIIGSPDALTAAHRVTEKP